MCRLPRWAAIGPFALLGHHIWPGQAQTSDAPVSEYVKLKAEGEMLQGSMLEACESLGDLDVLSLMRVQSKHMKAELHSAGDTNDAEDAEHPNATIQKQAELHSAEDMEDTKDAEDAERTKDFNATIKKKAGSNNEGVPTKAVIEAGESLSDTLDNLLSVPGWSEQSSDCKVKLDQMKEKIDELQCAVKKADDKREEAERYSQATEAENQKLKDQLDVAKADQKQELEADMEDERRGWQAKLTAAQDAAETLRKPQEDCREMIDDEREKANRLTNRLQEEFTRARKKLTTCIAERISERRRMQEMEEKIRKTEELAAEYSGQDEQRMREMQKAMEQAMRGKDQLHTFVEKVKKESYLRVDEMNDLLIHTKKLLREADDNDAKVQAAELQDKLEASDVARRKLDDKMKDLKRELSQAGSECEEEMRRLKDAAAEADKRFKEAQGNSEEAMKKIVALGKQVESQSQGLEEKKILILGLQNDLEEVRTAEATMRENFEKLEEEAAEKDLEIERLKTQNAELQEEVDRLTRELTHLGQTNENQAAIIRECKDQTASLQQEVDELKQQLAAEKEKVSLCQAEQQRITQDNQDQSRLLQACESSRAQLQEQVATKDATIRDLQQQLAVCNQQVESLRTQSSQNADQAREHASDLQQKLDACNHKAAAKESTIAQLRQEIKKLKEALSLARANAEAAAAGNQNTAADLERRIGELAGEKDKLRAENTRLQTQAQTCEQNLEICRRGQSQADTCESTLTELQSQWTHFVSSLSLSYTTHINLFDFTSLQVKLDQKARKCEDDLANCRQANDCSALERENGKLRAEITRLQTQVQRFTLELSQEEQCETQMKWLEGENEKLKREARKCKEDLAACNAAQYQAIAGAGDEARALQAQLAELQRQADACHFENGQLQQLIEALEDKARQCKKDLETCKGGQSQADNCESTLSNIESYWTRITKSREWHEWTVIFSQDNRGHQPSTQISNMESTFLEVLQKARKCKDDLASCNSRLASIPRSRPEPKALAGGCPQDPPPPITVEVEDDEDTGVFSWPTKPCEFKGECIGTRMKYTPKNKLNAFGDHGSLCHSSWQAELTQQGARGDGVAWILFIYVTGGFREFQSKKNLRVTETNTKIKFDSASRRGGYIEVKVWDRTPKIRSERSAYDFQSPADAESMYIKICDFDNSKGYARNHGGVGIILSWVYEPEAGPCQAVDDFQYKKGRQMERITDNWMPVKEWDDVGGRETNVRITGSEMREAPRDLELQISETEKISAAE
eukprot:gnl/TRDRNA2_/TRDRNA2_84380_c0_seq1.p1 gnl/TRDRNA2_/TRDRNA2_84380_c0~~gnl/TRDRNA2_/TRDRNA2_84380_c0_seq1.p1  ORF type:complete len:1267 (+),score=296.82 gnl/TRDRNA2_/TRDRNA2_84380_c0_seq1:94-3894(+)